MCLIAFAYGASQRFPWVIVANRDEVLDRPTAALSSWQSPAGHTIIGGRDLQDGGTWMGFTPQGRFAMLTNVRNPHTLTPDEPISRGRLALSWLGSDLDASRWIEQQELARYNGFNMILGSYPSGQCWYLTQQRNWEHFQPLAPVEYSSIAIKNRAFYLSQGRIYGLSNAALQTPWPKTVKLTQALEQALREADHAPVDDAQALAALQRAMLSALADKQPVPDGDLPQTGVPLELERALATAFVRYPSQAPRYGTRTSLVAALDASTQQLQILELTHASESGSGQINQAQMSWSTD